MTHEYLTPAQFEEAVGEALESLPKRFADMVQNVSVSVEEEPTEDDLADDHVDGDEEFELLGTYRGIPLTERTHDVPLLPDEIVIFRGPICRVAHSRAEVVREVRETVIHELGHYFGLGDDEMPF